MKTNSIFKRVLAVVLVMCTLFGIIAITANAASYSTGKYAVASSSGSNVRTGAGSGYSKVGAASKGTTFTVSKISGAWGYTSSIKCTNGTKSGWVCLDYCTYKGSTNSNRATYNDVFASLKGSGYSLSQARASQSTSFKKGDFMYIWAWVHDANNNLYKSYSSGTCNMTLSIFRPDGSRAYTYTYKNSDNNWIGCKLDKAGTWKIQSKITGSISGTNTQSVTVKETATQYYTLTYNANGGSNAPSSQRVKAETGFYLSSSKPTRSGYTFLGWSTSKSATSASFAPGTSVRINGNVTLYAVWNKNASTQTYTGYVNTSSAPLVLRQSASTSSKALANMPKGSSLTILDNKQKTNGFYHVKYNGVTGYASASYITFTKPSGTTSSTNVGNGIISSLELSNKAKSYSISTGSNAYKALQLINSTYAPKLTSSQRNGTLVFMFEGVGNNSSSSMRKNAMCVVIKNNKIVYINRNCSTIPDYPFSPSKNEGTAMPTIKSGIYSFSTVNHRGQYAALNVNNAQVVRFKSKSSYYNSTSAAINVHRRSSDGIAASNAGWVNSAGCLLVGSTGKTSTSEYARFIQAVGIVGSSSSATATYSKSVSGKIIVDRSFAYNYLSSVGYPASAIKAIG